MKNNNEKLRTKISAREALDFGWTKFYQWRFFFVAVSFVFMFFSIVLSFLDNIGLTIRPLIVFILFGTIYIFQAFLNAGFFTIILKTLREEGPSFKDFLGKGRYLIYLMVGSFLYSLSVSIGLIFFIVPGLFLAVRFYFFDFLIIDKDMKPVPALKKSYEMTKGYGWKIFLLALITLIPFLTVGDPFFLFITLIVIPVAYLTKAFFYSKLLGEDLNQISSSKIQASNSNLISVNIISKKIVLIVSGIIILIGLIIFGIFLKRPIPVINIDIGPIPVIDVEPIPDPSEVPTLVPDME